MIVTITLCTLIPLLLTIAYFSNRLHRRPGEPPVATGNWLWGNGAEFSRNAVAFLLKCKRTYGQVFTIRLLHTRMTLLMDFKDFEAMSKERNFDFEPIQKQVNWNVFHFVLKEPRRMMKETGKWVRGKAMVGNLATFCQNLNISYKNVMKGGNEGREKDGGMKEAVAVDKANVKMEMGRRSRDKEASQTSQTDPHIAGCHGTSLACPAHSLKGALENEEEFNYMGLRIFASNTMFATIFNTIFGFSDHSGFNHTKAFLNFDVFHKYFNYFWLGLPKLLFPEAVKALQHLLTFPEADDLLERHDLSPYIKNAIRHMRQCGQNDSDIKGHNLVFLHVNYNTFRISFWILYYLLSNADAFKALRNEMEDLLEERLNTGDNTLHLSVDHLDNLEVLDSVVTESFRMSSGVFMVRHVTKDTLFTSNDGSVHLMRMGDKVAIYPPAIHKDEHIFQHPEEFKYDRFTKSNSEDNPPQAILPFGSLCPGKRMAILQTKLYVLATLLRFDMRLLEGQRAELDTRYYGHEILPPKKDVMVAYRASPHPVTVTMLP